MPIVTLDDRSHAALYGQDPGMTCRVYTAKALWMLGCPDQALARVRETVTLFEELPNPYSLAMVSTRQCEKTTSFWKPC